MKHKKGANTSQKILLGIFIILAIAALAMVFMQVSATGFAIFGTNNAAFMYQNVPTTMTPGTNYTITIIMNNTGTNPWTTLGKYKLGSQSPQDNTNWGRNRVELPASPINKGKAVSFTFSVKAPTTPGNYSFQWKMVQEGKGWFGTATPKLPIAVASRSICGNNQCEAGETTTCAADCACADSDGGYNYSLLGFSRGPAANGTVFTVTDACRADGYSLDEAVCFGNTPGFTTYSCPYGCANGICKPYTQPPVVCGDGLCGTGEECEWNGTSQTQFMCPDNPTLPIGKVCSGCKLYNQTIITPPNNITAYVPLGSVITTSPLGFKQIITPSDLSKLKEGTSLLGNTSYKLKEVVVFAQTVSSPTLETSLTSGDYDFNTSTPLLVYKNSIKYYQTFQNATPLATVSASNPLNMMVLGQSMSIIGVNSNASMTVKLADGTVHTYSDGDAYIGQSETDPDWVWNIGGLISNTPTQLNATQEFNGPYIGITNDFVHSAANDPVTFPGNCLNFPNNYLHLCVNTIPQNNAHVEFEAWTSGVDLSDAVPGLTSTGAVVITTDRPDGLIINPARWSWSVLSQNVTTKTIYIHRTNSTHYEIYYADSSDANHIKFAGFVGPYPMRAVSVRYSNTSQLVDLGMQQGGVGNNWFTIDQLFFPGGYGTHYDNTTIRFMMPINSSQLGNTSSFAEPGEITWKDRAIGSSNNDLRNVYGIIIRNPNINGANDKVVLEIPQYQIKPGITLY